MARGAGRQYQGHSDRRGGLSGKDGAHFLGGGHSHPRSLRPDRNLAGTDHQSVHPTRGHARQRGPAPAQRADPHRQPRGTLPRRRRRNPGARPQCDAGLLQPARGHRRGIYRDRRETLVPYRRCGDAGEGHRRARVSQNYRPQEGAAQNLGRQIRGPATHREQDEGRLPHRANDGSGREAEIRLGPHHSQRGQPARLVHEERHRLHHPGRRYPER